LQVQVALTAGRGGQLALQMHAALSLHQQLLLQAEHLLQELMLLAAALV
jgi:hypothetical protein